MFSCTKESVVLVIMKTLDTKTITDVRGNEIEYKCVEN